jgi:hypothetical protein
MAKPPYSHTLYAFSRSGKKSRRLLECGKARVEIEGSAARIVYIYQDRSPKTGDTGFMILTEIGAPPPKPTPPPDEDGDDDEEPVRPSSIQPVR